MFRSLKISELIFLGIFFLFTILCPLVYVLSDLKFIALPVFILLLTIAHRKEIECPKVFFSWVLYGILGLASIFWCINGALIWTPIAILFCFLLWLLLVHNFCKSDNFRHSLENIIISLGLMFFVLFLFFRFFLFEKTGGFTIDFSWLIGKTSYPSLSIRDGVFSLFLDVLNSWNFTFGKNANFVSSYAIFLLPFILQKVRSIRYTWLYGFLAICAVYLVISSAYSRTNFLSLFLCLFLTFFLEYKNKLKIGSIIKWLLLAATVILFIALILKTVLVNSTIFSEFGSIGDSIRRYQIEASIKVWLNNPFLGIGLGNWINEAYTFDVSKINGLNDARIFIRMFNHNVFTNILAETGLLGFTLFMIPFVFIVIKGFNNYNNFDTVRKAGYTSLLLFLFMANFYSLPFSSEGFFSEVHLLGITSIGIVSSSLASTYSSMKFKPTMIICSALLSIYFWQNSSLKEKYISAIDSIQDREISLSWIQQPSYNLWRSSNQFPRDGDKLIEKLKELYIHNYFTHVSSYYSIPFQIAKLYEWKGDVSNANYYYKEAIILNPNSENLLLNYSMFNLMESENIELAKAMALKTRNFQKNNHQTNLVLAQIAIETNDLVSSRNHINMVGTNTVYDEYLKLMNDYLLIREDSLSEDDLVQLIHKSYRFDRTNQLRDKIINFLSKN